VIYQISVAEEMAGTLFSTQTWMLRQMTYFNCQYCLLCTCKYYKLEHQVFFLVTFYVHLNIMVNRRNQFV